MLDDYGPETFTAIREEMDFAATNMLASDLSLLDAAPWYETFTDAMRAHALHWLLIEGDAQTCFRDLTLSGHVRRHFLRRCQRAKLDTFHRASSRMPAFLDAVAAHSLDVARDIALSSPATWLENDEYEDDFCYARFLHLWVIHDTADRPRAEMTALLERFERALEGNDSARLETCRALLTADEKAFRSAFGDLVAEREQEVRARLPSTVNEPVARLDCEVFVEGLALLRLAGDLALRTDPAYPGCPQLARARSRLGVLPDTLPPL